MNTLPFLEELEKNAAMNRISFIALLNEMDVKGKLSGKGVTSRDGYPVDIIGYFIQRLGYNLRREHDFCDFHGGRELTWQVARFALNCKLTGLGKEIDRHGSTNETIRAFVKNIFDNSPIGESIGYLTIWSSRGSEIFIQYSTHYSTEATATGSIFTSY